MLRAVLAPLAALAFVAAAPAPSPSPAPSESPAPLRVFVLCKSAPFYVFNEGGTTIPYRTDDPPAQAGQVFEAMRSRTTLHSLDYVETNVIAIGPNFAGHHLWLWKGCVSVQ